MISFLLLNLGQGPSRTVELRPKGHHVPSYLVDLWREVCPCGDLYRCHPVRDIGAQAEMTKRLSVGRALPQSHFHHEPQTHFSNCINFFWEKCLAAGRRIVTLKQSQPPARRRAQLCWSAPCTFFTFTYEQVSVMLLAELIHISSLAGAGLIVFSSFIVI